MVLWWTYQQLRASNVKTRLAAIAKLAEFRQTDSVEPLLFALKDQEVEVRTAAALALGGFQDSRVLDPLIHALADTAPLARSAAVEALGHLGDVKAVQPLIGSLRDEDSGVRKRAARSLERLGWHPGNDAERTWHSFAAGNLTRVVQLGSAGIAPLVELIHQGDPEKQLSAIKALGEIGEVEVIPPLLEALKGNLPQVRIAALQALESYADPSIYEPVAALLRDTEPGVRAAAVETAVHCGGQRAVPALVEMLQDSSWEVRHEAVKALGSLGGDAAVAGLCSMLQDKDRDVRESAVAGLGRVGRTAEARALRSLVLAMLDVEYSVRMAANLAIRRVDRHWEKTEAARSALPEIKAALNHREYWISQSAGKMLERIQAAAEGTDTAFFSGPERATPAGPTLPAETAPHPAFAILSDLLRDSDGDLRLVAAAALGEIHEPRAAILLVAAAQDPEDDVRRAAERALRALN